MHDELTSGVISLTRGGCEPAARTLALIMKGSAVTRGRVTLHLIQKLFQSGRTVR